VVPPTKESSWLDRRPRGGVSGHTAALHLKRLISSSDTVTVVSPNSQWNWIPSNIWVGSARWRRRTSSSRSHRVPAQGHRLPAGEGGCDPSVRDAANTQGAVDIEYTRPDKAGTVEPPLRLPHQRHGPSSGRGHAGLGPTATRSRSARPTTPSSGTTAQRDDRRLKAGVPQTLVVGPGTEPVRARCCLRVRLSTWTTSSARPAYGTSPGGLHHQRGRSRRLRRRRDGVRPAGLPDHERAVDRVPVPRARRRGDRGHARLPGPEVSSTTRRSTGRSTRSTSTSRSDPPFGGHPIRYDRDATTATGADIPHMFRPAAS